MSPSRLRPMVLPGIGIEEVGGVAVGRGSQSKYAHFLECESMMTPLTSPDTLFGDGYENEEDISFE